MELRVVGVGLGRTGTHSLKLALEQLLGAPCHHMIEILEHPEQMEQWVAAVNGQPAWDRIYQGYVATVDWPGAGFWRELVAEYPNAVVLLSQRTNSDAWWASAQSTIFELFNRPAPDDPAFAPMAEWLDTVRAVLARNGVDPTDGAVSKQAYEAHLAAVRREVPAERLVEWTTGDGWAPLCRALELPEPMDPFPHVNTTEEFRAMLGLDS